MTVVSCARCGVRGEGPPIDWVSNAENGRTSYYCTTCARENLRAIEARLDVAWW